LGLAEIQEEVAHGNFRFSAHARRQMADRRITVEEVREAIARGEIIEDYPEDKYRPSRLILGTTDAGRPLHAQCCEPMPEVIVITCYQPDPEEWGDLRIRRH
jgi:hypothetical protein